ncbi:EscU/YscU/HrcU family type III secretion system export apparatus switch protein, partial [Campylobacter sp. 46490-21]
KEDAPVVLAKGIDFMALQIKKIGLENGVEIVENPPLARELYRLCDIDRQIPSELFKAVAEVLSFVYTANKQKFAKKLQQ